jgi:uncharacterized protein YqjF (DUF2071 family)
MQLRPDEPDPAAAFEQRLDATVIGRTSAAMTGDDRPWPRPARPWVMAQTWHDLLFMHWPVSIDRMRALVPAQLPLDTFDGQAWVGVVPFRMSGVRPRYLPGVPWLSAFPELNVRTYVTLDGKPGVYFFSLDAGRRLAVEAARRYGLPYYHARMSCVREGRGVAYESLRIHPNAPDAALLIHYRPTGPRAVAESRSLDDWLTARYCVYTVDRRDRVFRIEIDHSRWPLQPADAQIHFNTMMAPLGLALPDTQPLLHFARRLDVVVWLRERVRPDARSNA